MPNAYDFGDSENDISDSRAAIDDYPFTVLGIAAAADHEWRRTGRPVPRVSHARSGRGSYVREDAV